jgi:hypothetical protein
MCYSALDNPADRRLSQRLKANVFRNVKYKTWPPIFLRSNFKKSSLPLFFPRVKHAECECGLRTTSRRLRCAECRGPTSH